MNINNEEKEIILKYLEIPEHKEDVEQGLFYDLIKGIQDYAIEKFDYYTNIETTFIMILIKAGLFKNISLIDNNTLRILIPDDEFIEGINESNIANEFAISKIINGKNPFNYNITNSDLKDWVLNEKTLAKIWDEEGNQLITDKQLDEIKSRCSSAYNTDLNEYWSQEIHYKLYEDDRGFPYHNAVVNLRNNKLTEIKISIKDLEDAIKDYEEESDRYDNSLYDGVASSGTVKALLNYVDIIEEPYFGWGDDVEFDKDYGDEIVSDVLGE